MRARSSLTEVQRGEAVALFEAGLGRQAVVAQLGVSLSAVTRLHDRWCVRGIGALATMPSERAFSFEFTLEVVQRFLAGDTKVALAREFDLSSPKLIETWARKYRSEGEDGLRSKRVGCPPGSAPSVPSEVARLRAENERLRAEVAYLGKLRASREQERR
ncbi:helix-turn-helix domain-containing protein [Rhodococcus qingshengii]|uniref:helix-turn-helix domain-containing protein n=1 Tax=Rhodococcus qingshengii TaxID=334542 RepID=UPI001BE6D058|nr:helix-turn-helix domain-containing protein [Rhodococcus qingshengii]MBT2275338.1 helix-turn-helix domain-containing protein [Rhodococcus qingshengii]